jgi:hypothetical protein
MDNVRFIDHLRKRMEETVKQAAGHADLFGGDVGGLLVV